MAAVAATLGTVLSVCLSVPRANSTIDINTANPNSRLSRLRKTEQKMQKCKTRHHQPLLMVRRTRQDAGARGEFTTIFCGGLSKHMFQETIFTRPSA